MQKYQDVVLNQNGNPVSGVQVTVTDLAGSPVAVYSSNAIGLNVNPLTSDNNGRFSFYAPDGRYSLTFTFGGNVVASISDILLEDPMDGSDAVFNDVTMLGSLSDASKITSAAVGGISATNVQDALSELDSDKASNADLSLKVNSADLAAPGGSALVGYDGGTVQTVLDDAKPMANYTALRNYTGRATGVRITQAGLAGHFFRDDSDTTSADNGGTIIVDASGRRWKRLLVGPLNIQWFGAASNWNGSTGTDDTTAIQAALDYAYSLPGMVEVVNPGVSKVTGTLIMGSNVIFRRGGLTCTADNIPIIKVSKDALNSYWQIRDMALVYQNPQSAVGSGNAIQLGDTNTISYEYEIANISTNNARSAVSLPSLTGAFAFLGRHQNIRSYKGTGTAFEILGSATGAHTTLSFIDCYYQGEPGSEISTASLFNIRNVVGLDIDQCACDRSALSTGSLALFTSCKGRIGTIVLEGNPMSRASGLGSFFEFSGGEMVCSHLIATDHTITLTGSGGFGFVRLSTGAIVNVNVISDLGTTVVDSSSDNYYTVSIDSTSILYNDAFKSSGATPALSTNEFSTTNPTKYARRLNGSTRTAVEAGRLVMFGTAPPTSGTFAVGDKVKNTAVSGTSPVTEWQCLGAGTPGTWRAVGSFNGLGPTASRPTLTANDRGVMYFDTTLDADGKPIWWTGTAWVDATGAVV